MRTARSILDAPGLESLKAACSRAWPHFALKVDELQDVVEDPAFQRRLSRGQLDVDAVAEALLAGKFERWRADADGKARDGNRLRLEALRRGRPRPLRIKVTRLFRLLLSLQHVERVAAPDGTAGLRPEWDLGGDAEQHARGLLSALLATYPELGLLLPDRTGLPRPPLTRRSDRDPTAAIQKRTREALRKAGLPDFLAGRLLRDVGIAR